MNPQRAALTDREIGNLIASDAYWKSTHSKHHEIHNIVRNWFIQRYEPQSSQNNKTWQQLGDVLLVGEGNLSFANSLIRLSSSGISKMVATTYESERSLPEEGKTNAQKLEKIGVAIIHHVDAARLDKSLPPQKFDTIIFQFPNVGSREAKYGRNPNYIMIRRFLESAASFLKPAGKILISVVDNPYYQGAFQFEEAAKYAGYKEPVFVPFDPSLFSGYSHTNTNDKDSALDNHGEFLTWVFRLEA